MAEAKETEAKKKTVHDLEIHEILLLKSDPGSIEVMRVEGGWIYILDFPGWRQSNTVFVPYHAPRAKSSVGKAG